MVEFSVDPGLEEMGTLTAGANRHTLSGKHFFWILGISLLVIFPEDMV